MTQENILEGNRHQNPDVSNTGDLSFRSRRALYGLKDQLNSHGCSVRFLGQKPSRKKPYATTIVTFPAEENDHNPNEVKVTISVGTIKQEALIGRRGGGEEGSIFDILKNMTRGSKNRRLRVERSSSVEGGTRTEGDAE